jgi:hypothetical protein
MTRSMLTVIGVVLGLFIGGLVKTATQFEHGAHFLDKGLVAWTRVVRL